MYLIFVFFVRISVVFRVKSAQTIKITDADLMKRLLLIVLVFAVVMAVRMVAARPCIVAGQCVRALLSLSLYVHPFDIHYASIRRHLSGDFSRRFVF
jgi:hypothetical protein